MQYLNHKPLKTLHIMQPSNSPKTQDHLQDLLVICILNALGRIGTEEISAITLEIQKKCPKLNMGDSPNIWVNPDDLTLEFIPDSEIQEQERKTPGFFSKYFNNYILEETNNDDISANIAIY